MTEALNGVYQAIDDQHADKSAATRRQVVAGAAAAVGGIAALSLPEIAAAEHNTDVPTLFNIAATAEVLATIVNTVGPEKITFSDPVTKTNINAAAREELIHYQVLTSSGVGGKELTKKIWIPDAVFANETNLLNTLVVGDQIFVNAYMIGTTTFATKNNRNPKLARITSEFMGTEAVHRALARQSLGKLGNDRVFMHYRFTRIEDAVTKLKGAGFGFGEMGKTPGAFYDFDAVSARTPNPPGLNTLAPR